MSTAILSPLKSDGSNGSLARSAALTRTLARLLSFETVGQGIFKVPTVHVALGCVYMRKYFGSNRHIRTVKSQQK